MSYLLDKIVSPFDDDHKVFRKKYDLDKVDVGDICTITPVSNSFHSYDLVTDMHQHKKPIGESKFAPLYVAYKRERTISRLLFNDWDGVFDDHVDTFIVCNAKITKFTRDPFYTFRVVGVNSMTVRGRKSQSDIAKQLL